MVPSPSPCIRGLRELKRLLSQELSLQLLLGYDYDTLGNGEHNSTWYYKSVEIFCEEACCMHKSLVSWYFANSYFQSVLFPFLFNGAILDGQCWWYRYWQRKHQALHCNRRFYASNFYCNPKTTFNNSIALLSFRIETNSNHRNTWWYGSLCNQCTCSCIHYYQRYKELLSKI